MTKIAETEGRRRLGDDNLGEFNWGGEGNQQAVRIGIPVHLLTRIGICVCSTELYNTAVVFQVSDSLRTSY
jgi:hypothetical protein